jgi:hypothetical protein
MENTIPSGIRLAQPGAESSFSAVSWGAIIAGAVAASVVSLCLMLLGAGLGLTAVSPWAGEGTSGEAAGIASMAWVLFMQAAAALLGGYMAGRLRVKWTGLDRDEIVFRDSAHGFLTWALGTIIAASFLASAASAVISAAATVGATAGAAATAVAAPAAAEAVKSAQSGTGGASANPSNPNASIVDTLFRSANPQADNGNNGANARAEAGRILSALKQGTDMSREDRAYLAKSIAANSGISEEEADKRVSEALAQIKARETQAREAADKARKAVIQSTLWMFIGLLLGAFTACVAAIWGGRQRDLVTS